MTQDEVLDEFRASGALLEGHFKLSSGRHSGHYLQCARVLMNPMFLERPDGEFHLRRGFSLAPGAKVLMVEDVVTTGLSSREAITAVGREGAEVLAEVALVDRSNGSVDLGVPFFPLIDIDFPTYAEGDVPAELAALPITKPGSRK